MSFDPVGDYPLGTERPDLVRTPGGRSLDELTLDALRAGELTPEEMRVTPEALEQQAAVARAVGRPQLALSLERAAELTALPADLILEIYTALRPRRSTEQELEQWADRLELEFAAPLTAAFVREAKAVYADHGLLLAGEREASTAV